MKQFKRKNRQKRKYVKKHDLESSLSHVLPLTLGVVPMLLMAVAFFTTFIISNPQVAKSAEANLSFHLPSIDIPEVTFPTISIPEVSLPELPKLSLPQVDFTFELPAFTMPDLISPAISAFIMFSNGITTAIDAGIHGIDVSGKFLIRTAAQTVSVISFGITSAEHWTITALSEILTAVVNISVSLGNGTVSVFRFVGQVSLITEQAIVHWVQVAWKVFVNGLNAFIWFIGTPFRALGDYSYKVGVALSPVTNFIGSSFNHAVNDFNTGANGLRQSANYVSGSVETQNQNDNKTQ